MEYWICITNEENWQIIKKSNVWGVSKRWKKNLMQTKSGDHLLFYVMQTKKDREIVPSRIAGIFEAVSEPYTDKEKLFKAHRGNEIYPYRIKINPIKIAEKIINFKELVPKLTFIKNKKAWPFSLRTAMRTIPEKDYQLIKNQL